MSDERRPNALAAYSMILLRSDERYLLLRRADSKRFAPGRWTGLGGRVEPAELGDPRAAALRELREETGIEPEDVARFTLRRVLLHARPGAPITVLLYFTGEPRAPITPARAEGTLAWLTAAEIPALDVIENTAQVLPLLIDDLARDPEGQESVQLGAARYGARGDLERIVWA